MGDGDAGAGHVNIPPDLRARLDHWCERTGHSEEEMIDLALRRLMRNDEEGNAVFLSAPINALVAGIYRENTTVADLRHHGDFGLGTFNDLDGEMVIIDGEVWQLRSDGLAYEVPDEAKTPFACVTFYAPDTVEEVEGHFSWHEVDRLILDRIPSQNMFYAIRLDGVFDFVKTRSVPKQDNYRPLVEVTRDQPTFEFENVRGNMAGFWTPPFMQSINVPGYHIHFLTEDRQHGGHLIECRMNAATLGVQHIAKLELGLPVTLDFMTADLTRDTSRDLEEAER
jgi:acetolactate decarboxylase